jgi:glycosyltransferase involved in cell wall biosynthesis
LLGRRLLAGSSAVIATSQQEVEELATAGVAREKIVVRRNGVEAPATWVPRGKFRTSLGIPSQARLILFLGRLSLKKSPELLLQAFAQLPANLGENDLMLAFAGPDEGGLQQRLALEASQLGLSSRVKFSGPIFGEDKWAAYRDADVFVLPSRNENFGNTAAEAVAAGTPAVVTQQCGVAPHLKDIAGLVVPHDAASLSNALARLLTDSQLHARFVAGCADVTSRLGWEEPVAELESLYVRLISRTSNSTIPSRPGSSL